MPESAPALYLNNKQPNLAFLSGRLTSSSDMLYLVALRYKGHSSFCCGDVIAIVSWAPDVVNLVHPVRFGIHAECCIRWVGLWGDLVHCRKKGINPLDIILLNIHETTLHWYLHGMYVCMYKCMMHVCMYICICIYVYMYEQSKNHISLIKQA